jgi:putative CocE/NonD family hydrolase
MPELDSRDPAWRETPNAYLARRPAEYRRPARPFSLYVPMRDGCRLAVDVHLPEDPTGGAPSGGRWPTILFLTPYYRRFAVAPTDRAVEPSPGAGRFRDLLVPRGYALVVVDVRGTGASFGTRDSFRSPVERQDGRELADWIVRQPWSDGQIGSTGISYVGAAATFLATTGHPAVKAIAPLFAVWDTWSDHYYPGGVLLNRLARSYDDLMVALDHDRRDLLRRFAYFADPAYAGPQPVDDDPDGALCRAAVAEHLGNFRMPDFIAEFRFRDDRLPYDPAFGPHAFSPCGYAESIREDLAIYSISGWMDGAGFANGAIVRFLSLPTGRHHLLLGPWDHGARANVSPWRESVEPRFSVLGEVLRFLDEYLQGRDTGLRREAPVHYFTLHAEAWRAADGWPPVAGTRTLFLGDGRLLSAAGAPGADRHRVDLARGTGTRTRHERLAAEDTREYYPDWEGCDAGMLRYDSDPLARDVEVSGHPVVTLWVESSEGDAAVFAYLAEVEADGRVRYVTEGVLRALHRREAPAPRFERRTWPYRTFARADAALMPAGRAERLRFGLLPTSWLFRAGSRIRLAIAGADADHYAQVPHGRPPLLTLHRGREWPSAIELPWREGSQGDAPREGRGDPARAHGPGRRDPAVARRGAPG